MSGKRRAILLLVVLAVLSGVMAVLPAVRQDANGISPVVWVVCWLFLVGMGVVFRIGKERWSTLPLWSIEIILVAFVLVMPLTSLFAWDDSLFASTDWLRAMFLPGLNRVHDQYRELILFLPVILLGLAGSGLPRNRKDEPRPGRIGRTRIESYWMGVSLLGLAAVLVGFQLSVAILSLAFWGKSPEGLADLIQVIRRERWMHLNGRIAMLAGGLLLMLLVPLLMAWRRNFYLLLYELLEMV